jgi:hypothetical protein
MGPKAIGFAFSVQVEIFPVRTIKFPAEPKKFPACLRREFGCKALKLPRDLMLFSEKLAWNRRNSLQISLLAREFALETSPTRTAT